MTCGTSTGTSTAGWTSSSSSCSSKRKTCTSTPLLDTSLSMDFGTPTKLRYGKQVAAALAFIGLCNHDRDPGRHLQRAARARAPRHPRPLADVAGRPVPRSAQGHRLERPDQGRSRVCDPPRRQGRRRRHLRLSRQARLPGGPPLPAGAEHGHLRRFTSSRRRRSTRPTSATCAWSTAKTTRSPRSPSAPP